MGLLDEAIREHLDLKRRRGADPAEIERAEREALGPVRRNRHTAAIDDPDGLAEQLLDDDALSADQHGLISEPIESAYDEPDEPIAGDLVEEVPPFVDLAADEPPIDDAMPTRLMSTTDIPEPSDATTEYAVEDALAAEDDPDAPAAAGSRPPADADDDVLEETPEFLQETPDHDRLWFEQRPPRDFDFDG